MATIYSNKNQLISSNGSQNNLINKGKTQNKLFVSSNIFASQYQIKNVHIIDGGSILYEALKNNKMQIIHQVVLWKEDFNTKNLWSKISKLCCLPFIEKVFFEDVDYERESIDFQYLSQFLENNDNIKIKIVLQSSFRQQLQINQNQFNLQNILDQFLIILKQFNQLNIKYSGSLQNSIVLRNQITKQFSFYSLNFLIFNKMAAQPLQTLIKLYLVSSVSKNIKEYLNFRNKKYDFLFQIYESKLKKSEIKEFIDLLKNVLQNQEKYTQKMLICYIQILRQKYLKNVEQNSMSKYLSNQKLSFQPPQRDNSPNFSNKEKQKQSNSFYQKKPKSFSRKLKIEKQQNQTSDQFRHSYGKKTSSIISMSPNRKNRKYLKYTNTNLFPSSKENLHRSSSASLLLKTTQNFYQNTQNSFFLKNNSIGTPNYQTQNNFLKADQNQNISLSLKPESQIKSYLQMMGFGNKNLQRASKLNDQNLSSLTNTGQSYHQVSAKEISLATNKIEPNEIKRQSKEMMYLNLNDDQKKMRLKQSLSLFEKKRFSQNFAAQIEIPNKNNFQIQARNQLRIQQRQQFLKHQKISHKQSTQIQKNHQPNKQNSIKFNITHQNCMNINIQGTKKQKKLQIQRSTVMVMHFVSFERIQTKEKSTIFKQNTDKSIEENMFSEVKKQKQLSFKPSLASLKKEKIGQKSQRHQKISPNDAQQKLISRGQQKLQNKKRQPEQQKTISQNQSLAESKMIFKSQKQVLSSINQSYEIQTEHLSKNSIEGLQKKQNKIINSVALSKQFLKQIFLFINSQNKTFVDLLGSKLSYQITFYAFYINYFKLNVTKATTRQAIQKMTSQIRDYEGKIMDSQKLSSLEKMLPQFDLFVKRLINLKIQDFMEKYWRKQELIQKEKQSIIHINEQIDFLTVGILKVTLKIIMSRLRLYKTNEKQTIFVLKSLKISSTICQLIYCISNRLLSMTVTEIKKISQIASQNQFSYEKNIISSLSKTQGIIQMYNDKIKQTQTNSQIKIDIPSEIKNIEALLTEVQK